MKRLTLKESGLTKKEYEVLKRLSTPIKIQDFLDTLAFNWEKGGDTHRSPRYVLKEKKAHCIEGALFAAAALWVHGEPPLLMNLSPRYGRGDFDHVVALYKRGGMWGAVSKTNHACLRFRDPIYRTPRELALSYFHEWFINETAEKVLEQYSKPLDLRRIGVPSGAGRFGTDWLTTEKDLWEIADALDEQPYYQLVPKGNWKYVRKADPMELKAGTLIEWPRSHPRA
ncbi:MAG: hypothetical protein WC798_02430 [Candidatus Paceibacterota bacterium]|jgi:hypothetical protein